MSPDLLLALMNLDRRTPAFFVEEIWGRGDRDTTKKAAEVIGSLGSYPSAAKLLRLQLALIDRTSDYSLDDGVGDG